MKFLAKKLFFILSFLIITILVVCAFFAQQSNTTYFFWIEGAIIVVILLLIVLYKKVIKPYQLLNNSMELIKEQDFSIRLRPIANSEANELIEIFNKMMDQLRSERLKVREKNHFLDLLIQASPQGVLILDFDNNITLCNPTATRLLGLEKVTSLLGKKLIEIDNPICANLATMGADEEKVLRIGGVVQYRCTTSSFLEQGFSHPFILIEELTHELLTTEKKSYETIIRLMAHEVNNSLSGVMSILSVVEDIAKDNQEEELLDIVPALGASQNRCEHLAGFIKNFADVVRIPEPKKINTNIHQLLLSICKLYEIEYSKKDIHLTTILDDGDFSIFVDPVQLEQVILNILKNAYEAIGQSGNIIIETDITTKKLRIRNDGPLLTPEMQQKLFTPFFTTKKDGQGIGLMFIREVLLNHHFNFTFFSQAPWTIFEIELKEK